MSGYENILSKKDMTAKVILQLGKGLYNLDPTRKVLKSYKDLPAVNVPYTLLEIKNTEVNDETFAETSYINVDLISITREIVKSYTTTVTVTASSNSPFDYLDRLVEMIHDVDWREQFFGKENVSLQETSNISDSSLPVESGDWEIRSTCNVKLRYLAKTTTVSSIIDTITGTVEIDGEIVEEISSVL